MTSQRRDVDRSSEQHVWPASEANLNSRPARVSVIVITFRRPDCVNDCLTHLARLEVPPMEVLVIDASTDDLTGQVVDRYPFARRVSFPEGGGHMTRSRNVGLFHVSGDILAFIDDDANVRPQWMNGLLDAFASPQIGAVAGRTCNGLPDEESEGVDSIGRVLLDGQLTGNFAAHPASIVDTDHGIGANMAFRREVLAHLGGFRDDYLGIGGLREDTDSFLRVRALGYRTVFAPDAVVDHLGAPHVKGRRFDYRYMFWGRHNHALLLARNFGLGSQQFKTWTVQELRRVLHAPHRNPLRRAARIVIGVAGVAAGMITSLRKSRWIATDPVRRDRFGKAIRRRLSPPYSPTVVGDAGLARGTHADDDAPLEPDQRQS